MAIYFLFPSHSSKKTRNSYIGLLYSKKDALITLKSLLGCTSFSLVKRQKKYISNHLWIRNCVSTITSQLNDSTLFICIAFYSIYDSLVKMILAQYIVKVIIALLGTSFVYWGRNILQHKV